VLANTSSNPVTDLGFALLNLATGQPSSLDLPPTVSVATDVLDTYVGVYDLSPTFKLTVTRQDDRLYVQATGQQPVRFFPSAPAEFYSRSVDASISFVIDGSSGAVTSLVLHQNGDQTATRE